MTSIEFEKLKINDIVVCINNYGEFSKLKIGERYIVNSISPFLDLIMLNLGNKKIESFVYDRFMTLKEYELIHRLDKIKKIISNENK